MFIALKPRDQRDAVGDSHIARCGAPRPTCPASRCASSPVQNINLNAGGQSRAQYQYTLQSADLQALYAAPHLACDGACEARPACAT